MMTWSMKRYDLVYVGFAPQLIIPLFGWRFRHKIVVQDFFISLYDTMVWDRKKFKDKGLAAKILAWLDKFTINRANAVITDTLAHAEYFVREFGVDPGKLKVLYLEADPVIYYPRQAVKPVEWQNKFVVLYFGSVLPLQGVDTVLACVKRMEGISSVVFDIIGPVAKKDLQQYAKLHNVRFTPWLSQADLAERIAAADLCLAGHFNKTIAKASRTIPGKAYIYRAMGRPVILGDNPANREQFSEDKMNFYVEMGSAGKLQEKILYAMSCLGLSH